MDRIKYRSVFLSDMQALEERDPNIWQFFLGGHFSVQINRILGTAKSLDHVGEQKNKALKTQDGFIGIKR